MTSPSSSCDGNSQIEELVYYHLEYFAYEDAITLAELYHQQVQNKDSLYLFAQCLLKSGQLEAAYKLLSVDDLKTAQLRYLFAHCCYSLKKTQEAEYALRMDDAARLHSVFEGSSVKPFAHALLARIFLESGRTSEATVENRQAIERNKLSWSSLKTHCDLGISQEVESLCVKLIYQTNKARDVFEKGCSSRSLEKRTPLTRDVKDIMDEKTACMGPKKPRTDPPVATAADPSSFPSVASVPVVVAPQAQEGSAAISGLSGVTCRVESISHLVNDPTKWTPVFVDIVEQVACLGRVQSHLSRYSTAKALKYFDELPEHCSSSPLSREILAHIFFERLEYAKTREILERLHLDWPYHLSGMEVLSTALWHEQDSRQLSMLSAELTENARSSAETWCVAGNCFSVQKQHETAIECFERAVTLQPRFAYAYTLLGHELLDTDQLDKAANSFRRALCLCPTDYRAWFGLGLQHFKREQITWARYYLKRAVSINANNSVLLCQLSLVEQALHNNNAAMDLLDRALKIAPDNAACRFYRARLLYEMRDYEECCFALNDLKLFAHDEAQVFFLLGRVYKKLNNTHLALLNFSWAAEMDPRGEQTQTTHSESAFDDDPASPGEP